MDMKKTISLCILCVGLIWADEFSGLNIACPMARKTAPAVSAAYIVRVISNAGGVEEIQPGQERVVRSHSPDGLRVVSAVCGYGGMAHDFLRHLGGLQQAIREYPIDSNNDDIADGFLILWNLEGKSGGTVEYEAHSVNAGGVERARLILSP